MSKLHVWMNGEFVGVWSLSRSKVPTLQYASSWLSSPRCRPLSLSLPITTGGARITGDVVNHFFDNLLPDDPAVRKRLHARAHARSDSVFDLLSSIGRDCVGAVQLLPPGTEPEDLHRITGRALLDAEIAGLLRQAAAGQGMGAGVDGVFRLSLAGMQEKTALLQHEGQWLEPTGSTPTTHILKLPLIMPGGNGRPAIDHSVENEWLCAQFLQALDLPVAETTMGRFDEQQALVVKRFDRQLTQTTDGQHWIVRLPQEDFCQATGTPSARKYESHGGPGIERILGILSGSQNPQHDRALFVVSQVVFWLLAAIDGHGKNFSIFLKPGHAYTMTPLYDVLSAWPYIGHGQGKLAVQDTKMAMAIRSSNTHYQLESIRPRHLLELARTTGGEGLVEQVRLTVAKAPGALRGLEALLPPGFPVDVFNAMATGVERQCRAFAVEG